jgi:hypothetical protein
MPQDFDPLAIPQALVNYLQDLPEAERHRHYEEFARRALAAKRCLAAANEVRLAMAKADHPRLRELALELVELARDLHDYDPTSD